MQSSVRELLPILRRTVIIPSGAPLFYGIHQFEREFGLITKCEREMG